MSDTAPARPDPAPPTPGPAPSGFAAGYPVGHRPGAWDEAVDRAGGSARVRDVYRPLVSALDAMTGPDLGQRAGGLARAHSERGVTYGHGGVHRPYPLDPVPRVVSAAEWATLSAGLTQRVRALEAFLGDVYGSGEIVRDGVVPADLVATCPEFRADLVGVASPTGVRVHVAGVDVVRDGTGVLRVLEDNLRCPSGLAYAVANRHAMESEFPDLFARYAVAPAEDGGALLARVLRNAAGPEMEEPVVVVLTPGPASPAWAEHRMLARRAGVRLVTAGDLVVRGTTLFLRRSVTADTGGELRVHVVYRRVDDEDLDPSESRGGDPGAGVPGLMRVVRAGGVVLANAPGNGVADDKGVYTCVPDMIRYYLGESPLLPNVETARCWVPEERADALDRMAELVFKPVQGYGGTGIVFGPEATVDQLAALRAEVLADPRGWVAQPMLDLSTVPTLVGGALVPRPVDLRPFVLNDGTVTTVAPGVLSRVALSADSLLVNSSQGGGSKDTWVLADAPPADRGGPDPLPPPSR